MLFEFTQYPGTMAAAITLLCVAALLLAGYLTSEAKRTGAWRWVCAGMQYAAIILLLIILCNPSRPNMVEQSLRNSVLVFFDTSESMSVAGKESTRLDDAVASFRRVFNPADPEGCQFDIYGFDRKTYHSTLDGLARWGDMSELYDPVQILSRVAAEEAALRPEDRARRAKGAVVGAIVFTDGQVDNKSAATYPRCASPEFKTLVVGVGSDTPRADVRVTGVSAPVQVAIENNFAVEATVEGIAVGDRSVTVELLKNGRVVTSRLVPGASLSKSTTVTFDIAAGTKGSHTMTVRVQPLPGEENTANNARSTIVRVTERKQLRVLLVAQALDFNVGKVRQALSRDKKTDLGLALNVLKKQSANKAALSVMQQMPARQELFAYDVIVFGPSALDQAKQDQIDTLYTFVASRGGGIIFLPSHDEYNPALWRNPALTALLPAVFPRLIEHRPEAALPAELTREGLESGMLATNDMALFKPVAKPQAMGMKKKPAALTLLTAGGQPLVCVQRVGRGRTALVNVNQLYMWYREDLDGGMLRALMSGLATYLGAHAGIEAPIDLFAERTAVGAVIVNAYVRDSEFRNVENASAILSVNGNQMLMENRGDGHYTITIPRLDDESILASVEAEKDGVFLGERSIAAHLPFVRTEMHDTAPDKVFLKELAARMGGTYSDVVDLSSRSPALFTPRTKVTTAAMPTAVWPRWPLFMTIAGLFVAGWFLRRQTGLM